MIRVTILGSGSGGNCSYVESGKTRLLIDAGFSGRQIRDRLATIGRSFDQLDGVLLTHEHVDHIAGLPALCEKGGLPLYCNSATAAAVRSKLGQFTNYRMFQTGLPFRVGDIDIENFSVQHDAADPVGFVLHSASSRLGFLTDLGVVTKLVTERCRGCDALLVEANYDLGLLQNDTKRPWPVKQRIQSRHGHLSNEAAARLIEQLMSDRLEHLWLGHLSQDCNTPELARSTVQEMLNHLQVTHVALSVTRQDSPSATVELGGARTIHSVAG